MMPILSENSYCATEIVRVMQNTMGTIACSVEHNVYRCRPQVRKRKFLQKQMMLKSN